MKFHKLVHRLFLLAMFAVCATAVTLYAQSKVKASLPLQEDNVINRVVSSSGDLKESATYQPEPAVSSPVPASENKDSIVTQISGEVADTNNESTETTSGTSDSAKIQVSASNADSSKPITSTSGVAADLEDNKQVVEKAGTVQNVVSPIAPVRMTEVRTESGSQQQPSKPKEVSAPVESSNQVFFEPTVIEGEKLEKEKNPKISGAASGDYLVEDVQLITKDDGRKAVVFKGKAIPESYFNIFIFSKDPIVMTIKADQNGDWSYELARDLADGQHEVYVAMTEPNGKILSKSEPIAFVKTAQAISVIPISQLDENKSPMQKSVASYVLVAIVIMSVCLLIALSLIGILTYKYKTDETTVD